MAEFVIMNNVLVKYNGTAEEVVIPDGVEKIREDAFWFCKALKILTIPASVREICGSYGAAFGYCESLEQINLSDGLEKIGANAFKDCESLKSITLPASVKEIGEWAFVGCYSLKRVILSEGLEKIGKSAFYGCKLKSITIPATVKQIGNDAFDLKSVTFEGAAPKMGKDALGEVEVIRAPHASAADFSQYKEAYLVGFLQLLEEGFTIKEEIVEKNKKNIKQNAQKLCATKSEELFAYMLRNALIPLNVVDEFITKYNKEKNVARVAALSDYKENNFTEEQKEEQFNKQFELREPTFAELRKVWAFSKKEDGTYRISGYKGEDVDIVVPARINGVKVTEIGNGDDSSKNLFFGKHAPKVRTITLQDGIETIADYAFQSCESLEQVVLPESLEKIGKSAFARCKSLKAITIPASVKEIDGDYYEGAFLRCESLESVVLSEGLEKIAREAFSGCKSLTSITIPTLVKEIGYKAFDGCTSLEEVILPKEVEQMNISLSAFSGCTALKGENDFMFAGAILVAYTGSASEVIVPKKTKAIGACAFAGKNVSQIILPEGVETIGERAFASCKSLKIITIPASVKKIEERAFSQSIKEITFEGAIPKIGNYNLEGVEVIYARQVSIADFLQHKEAYLIGFVRLLQKSVSVDRVIIEKNNKYIKQHVKGICEIKNEELFAYMLQNQLIPLKDVDELIAKFSAEKNVARVAALIDYKEKNFTEKQRERQYNKQFEIREPTIAELKKDWIFTKKEDGTYRITKYKGKDIDVVIPATIKGVKVTQIGTGRTNLFDYDHSKMVRSVTLPDGLEIIEGKVFEGCSSLKSIAIPASVKEIHRHFAFGTLGGGAFSNCESLECVTLFEGLKTIESEAFYNCKSLKTITIPASVKTIEIFAFRGCANVTIYCRGNEKPAEWDNDWDKLDWQDGRVNVVWGYKGE